MLLLLICGNQGMILIPFLQKITENNKSLKTHKYFFDSRYFELVSADDEI